ncbi:F-box protein At3g07870-like [Papaver somniferum]|uniref:F-box protein At3g07870-like n=1 Tax=Papaver somniferum TaxID=3469 RepID=UPI000E7024DB|nr:F-box protein At3g07870-like [Papaver somniferum]
MEDFHEDILSEILSRVPRESVLNCKLVSKTWNILLSHRKLEVGILLCVASVRERNIQLHYGYYDEIIAITDDDHESFTYRTIEKTKHPVINKRKVIDIMVGSCNGLVCFLVPHHRVEDPVYICNPTSGEYVNLPRINSEKGLIVSGFGYNCSANNYKVIRIHYPNKFCYNFPPSAGRVQIYTLGGGDSRGWRNLEDIDYSLAFNGTHLNGSLYWLEWLDQKIVVFDLAEEEFRLLPPTPPCFIRAKGAYYRLAVLGGHLCFVHHKWEVGVDIWSFKSKPTDNSAAVKGYESWSWSLDFSVPFPYLVTQSDYYKPFALTRNNEVLLWFNHTTLCCYDPKTDIFSNILVGDDELKYLRGIPHVNSSVSLKALGVNSKMRKYGDKVKDKSSQCATLECKHDAASLIKIT